MQRRDCWLPEPGEQGGWARQKKGVIKEVMSWDVMFSRVTRVNNTELHVT